MNNMNIEGILLNKMIMYFQADKKRINHAIKVLGFSKAIAFEENIDPEQFNILIAAAILHDIGIKISEEKYNSSSGRYQEIEGPDVARQLMEDMNLEQGFVDRVCYMIGHHHSYSAIDGLDFQILVEADFLVNIFEDSIERAEINSILSKIFRTKSGIDILQKMYMQLVT